MLILFIIVLNYKQKVLYMPLVANTSTFPQYFASHLPNPKKAALVAVASTVGVVVAGIIGLALGASLGHESFGCCLENGVEWIGSNGSAVGGGAAGVGGLAVVGFVGIRYRDFRQQPGEAPSAGPQEGGFPPGHASNSAHQPHSHSQAREVIPLGCATSSTSRGFVGTAELKRKQADHLQKLRTLSQQGKWERLREHTIHPDSGFDWWMFPTDRESMGQGDKYKLGPADIEALKQDPEFMNSYREGVYLVLFSWGWDASVRELFASDKRYWTDYQERLGKMIHSLSLFGEEALFQNVKLFCERMVVISTLKPWIQELLKKPSS